MMATIKTFPLTSKKTPAVKGDWRQWDGRADTPVYGVVIPRGVYIIDLDTYKGVTTEAAEAAIGVPLDWSAAELQRTMRGGTHYAFRVPDSADLKNGSNLGGVDGFDTRASGKGYIATGKGYEPLVMFGVVATLENPAMLPDLPAEAMAFFAVGRGEQGVVGGVVEVAGDDDLLCAVASRPLDMSMDQVAAYMGRLTADQAADSGTWLSVMFGLYHQTGGSEEGWQLFDTFSGLAPEKYNERENRSRWESVGRSRKADPITFATVVALAGGRCDVAVTDGSPFAQLKEAAGQIDTLENYAAFKRRVAGMSVIELGPDLRAVLAGVVHESFGKAAGMGKADVKAALSPPRKAARGGGDVVSAAEGGADIPGWLADWCYLEKTCEFADMVRGYEIKQEAFNAKFSRMIDCVIAECNASHYALLQKPIPTYVDKMFWPGAGSVITQDGKEFLNSYRPQGIDVADGETSEGVAAVARMLRHVDMTLTNDKDRRILLDWIAYVYQNPGRRINWALLLQGGYGTGKSYFSVLMQTLMGAHVSNLEPGAIAGRFTGWAHGARVVVVEEIRISGANKFETMDKLKPFITNETVQIEEKGRDHRTVPNFTSYFLLTNHKDALPIKQGDRRFCVLFGAIQTEQQLYRVLGGEVEAAAYFDQLFADLRDHGPELARYFSRHRVADGFRPQGRAPDTAGKRVMLSVADSPDQMALVDMIDRHQCAVITESVIDVTWLRSLVEAEGGDLPAVRTMTAILLDLGYEPVEGKKVKLSNRENHYIWFDPSRTTSAAAKALVKDATDDSEFIPF